MAASRGAEEGRFIADAIELARERSGRPLQVLIVGSSPSLFQGAASTRGWKGWLDALPLPESFYEDRRCRLLCGLLMDKSSSVTVLDPDPRRLARLGGGLRGRLTAITADLGVANSPDLRPLRGSFDVVLAFGMLARLPDETRRKAAAWNIVALTAVDGLIVEDSGALAALSNIALAKRPCIYRRRAEANELQRLRRA
jgi:hypothetical protein